MIGLSRLIDQIKTLSEEKLASYPVCDALLNNDSIAVRLIKAAFVIFLGVFLSIWLLGALCASLVNIWYGALASLGHTIPEIASTHWYLTHPFQTSKDWLQFLLLEEPLSDPQVFYMWMFLNTLLVLFVIIPGAIMRHGHSKLGKVTTDRDSIHGSARFTEPHEAKDCFSFNYGPGIIFGALPAIAGVKPVVLKEDAPGNRNIAVFGPPGSMKSAGYIRNNMFQAVKSGWSVVITDPKGELVRDFRGWFEDNGYDVKIFNLVSMLNSDRWNPLHEVVDDITAQHFCNVVIANTAVPGRKGGDPFWDRLEMNLLKALVLFVVNELPENKNLGMVYSLLACGDSKQLDDMFQGLSVEHPARLPYNLFCETSGTVRSGAIIGLGTRLEVFQNRLVRELTAGNDIDLEAPGKRKCAYFCILSDTDSTFNFLASSFFTFLFISLTRLADRQENGQLPVPVNFLLDEFCNISGIPDFTKKISTMRGRGIACSVIFQNIPQLIETYGGEEWEIILGDCDYWLILGAREKSSAGYISEVLGQSTVESISDRRPKGLVSLNPWAGQVQISPTRRALMELSEVTRMNYDECVLRITDGRVLRLKKMFFKNHPWAKQLTPEKVTDYWPRWAREFKESNEEEQEEERFLIDSLPNPEPESKEETGEEEDREKTLNETLTPVNLIFPEDDVPDKAKLESEPEPAPDTPDASDKDPAASADETDKTASPDTSNLWQEVSIDNWQEVMGSTVEKEESVEPKRKKKPRKKPSSPKDDFWKQTTIEDS